MPNSVFDQLAQQNINIPQVPQAPAVVPQLQAPQQPSAFDQFLAQPGLTEALFAAGASLLGGQNVGQAGLNFVQSLRGARDREELKEARDAAQRAQAAQLAREEAREERRLRIEEILAGEKVTAGAAGREVAQQELAIDRGRLGVAQQEADIAQQRADQQFLEGTAKIANLDAETAQLNADLNTPRGVNPQLWGQALSTAKATAGIGPDGFTPNPVDVGQVLQVYNSISDTPIHLSIDSATLRSEVEAAIPDVVNQNAAAIQARADQIAEVYGDAVAERFIRMATFQGREEAERNPPQVGVFEAIFGGLPNGG